MRGVPRGHFGGIRTSEEGSEDVMQVAPRDGSTTLQKNGSRIGDYITLTKPRIMLLLLFTGFSAMIVALGRIPGWQVSIFTLVGLGLSTGGAAALNMWYDRDIDQIMGRTQARPIPAGRMAPGHALAFGIAAEVVAIAILGFGVNWLTALLAFAGFVYYVGIYTMWLKRRTPQNIVIGGGAGAFPPLVGWAAATGHLSWAAVWMFMIIFLWTPPHFWSLALYKNEDYVRAKIPMMPVVRGERSTKVQSLAYAVVLLASSVALYATGVVGRVYLAAALVLGVGFIVILVRLMIERAPQLEWAKRTFRYSLLYLLGVFAFMLVNVRS